MSRREAHVRRLAAELGVDDVRLVSDDDYSISGAAGDGTWRNYMGQSGLGDLWVIITGWDRNEALAYFGALHELGHHALGHVGRMRMTHRILEDEAEAWRWAFGQAEEEPPPEFEHWMRTYWLGTYVRDFGLSSAGPVYAQLAPSLGLSVPPRLGGSSTPRSG